MNARPRAARAADARRIQRVEGRDRGGLDQAIAREHEPAEPRQRALDIGFEIRAAARHEAEARRELPMEAREQAVADAHTQAVIDRERKFEHRAEQRARNRTARRNTPLNTGCQAFIETRHADHGAGFARAQRRRDLGPRDARGQHDRRAISQRQQHADQERIGMVQRQGQHHPVVRAKKVPRAQDREIDDQIAMAERHALGHAGCARGVEERRGLVRQNRARRQPWILQQPAPPRDTRTFGVGIVEQMEDKAASVRQASQTLDIGAGRENATRAGAG